VIEVKKHKWGIVTALAVIASTVVAALVLISPTKPQEPEWKRGTKLQVDDVYFLTGQDDNTEDNLIPVVTTLYLTNAQWNSSGSVKIVAYLLRTSPNIAVDKGTVEIGTIHGSETKEVGIQVVVPSLNTSYDVNFLIFENNLLVLRGKGSIEVVQISLGEYAVKIGSATVFTPITDNT
jgi:hypothetical protein